ncbi:hypothetical protein HMF7854_06285 [Sphingomonas ginkgonis]|uniref:DUF7847 domain-containing protein n=1 Tax=Sphingomonas ginkgonis TaxID=2315330 RepID=A0A3R9Z5V8_9SPHN|nr:glycerophosphoryl diester phosphodiesterase membrane domain-containing protein [Sphingomonas ginkgonis]RST30483.1 hypothetical protein HMF7854_06285 [Sphingomonas ginkgonis]
MRPLSISEAWAGSMARLRSDGRLYGAVGLAFFALPDLVYSVAGASSMASAQRDPGSFALLLLMLLLGMVGQLALARLALGGGASVGEAIRHAARRIPALIGAGFLVALPLMLPLVPILATLQGVTPNSVPSGGQTLAALAFLLWSVLVVWVAARLMLLSPVVTSEPLGPLAALRRTLALTKGRALRLFGLIVAFLIVAAVASIAISSAVGVVVVLALGRPEPWSVSALLLALVAALVQAAITVLFVLLIARIYAQLAAPEVGVPSSGT